MGSERGVFVNKRKVVSLWLCEQIMLKPLQVSALEQL